MEDKDHRIKELELELKHEKAVTALFVEILRVITNTERGVEELRQRSSEATIINRQLIKHRTRSKTARVRR